MHSRVKTDQGVKQPFEAVVAQHGATVLRVVRAVVGHPDADDAWSDTFLGRVEGLSRSCPPTPISRRGWSRSRTARPSTSRAPASRRAVPVAATPDSPDPTAPTASISMISTWTPPSDALPPKQRQAVAYHYLAGLPTPRSP